ncbi:MAG: hypothetical protein ACI8U4_002289 [Natronomonas sp.]|jgi:hypothetical protein
MSPLKGALSGFRCGHARSGASIRTVAFSENVQQFDLSAIAVAHPVVQGGVQLAVSGVLEDPERDEYYVLHDDYLYTYRPPSGSDE